MHDYREINVDVIVVGGGIAGITAAYTIIDKLPSHVVLLFEASERTGGRILTENVEINHSSVIYDLGGQWINSQQKFITKLLKKLNIKSKNKHLKGKFIGDFNDVVHKTSALPLSFGTVFDELKLNKFFALMQKYSNEASLLNPTSIENWELYDKLTMEEVLNDSLESEFNKEFLRNIMWYLTGVKTTKISFLFYIAFCHSTCGIYNQFMSTSQGMHESVIEGGPETLLEAMQDMIERKYVMKSEKVIAITRKPNHVIVKTTKKTYCSSYAIIAIPPQDVLQIKFEPPLSESRLKALRMFNKSSVVKFVVFYKKPFWKEQRSSGDIMINKDGKLFIYYDSSYHNFPALGGYIIIPEMYEHSRLYFPALDDMKKETEPIYKWDVIINLTKYFGLKALQPIFYKEMYWSEKFSDNYFYMNCPKIGCLENLHEIRRPIGRLFWAGTETATSWFGFMEGAVQSGYRAGIEVVYDSRPASLTVQDLIDLYPKQKQTGLRITSSIHNFERQKQLYIIIICIILVSFYKKLPHYYATVYLLVTSYFKK